jgi:riboflavin biosynthesis pyrimidine reductase
VGERAPASSLRALKERGVAVIRYDADGGTTAALRALAERGVCRVLAEPGPRLFTALWCEGGIDELVVYHAGVPAGPDAPAFFEGGDATAFGVIETGSAGPHAVTVWRPLDMQTALSSEGAAIREA